MNHLQTHFNLTTIHIFVGLLCFPFLRRSFYSVGLALVAQPHTLAIFGIRLLKS
ncbi:protein of unknown function [Vibrio tapetis subsp. tapetis]|uniref:Uncharacterized protein n=1 Tax=Vibrio tapetis subsp. tapetis TaxID=1671868 RepID=A0A2N8ZC78_9VIBR|nr:protein of unknown function [Vibrio tapetis subsp. tapetis]